MNVHDATEVAYRNGYRDGYAQGQRDAVKTGEWIPFSSIFRCSECGNTTLHSTDKYCGECGAKMGQAH